MVAINICAARPGADKDVATLRKGIPHAWGNRTNAEFACRRVCPPDEIEEVLRLIANTGKIDLAAIAERFRCKVPGSSPF